MDLKRSLSDQEWIIEQQKQEITQLQCTMRQSKEQAVETQHEDVPAFLNVEQQSLQLQVCVYVRISVLAMGEYVYPPTMVTLPEFNVVLFRN